jgi:hypothetical protein
LNGRIKASINVKCISWLRPHYIWRNSGVIYLPLNLLLGRKRRSKWIPMVTSLERRRDILSPEVIACIIVCLSHFSNMLFTQKPSRPSIAVLALKAAILGEPLAESLGFLSWESLQSTRYPSSVLQGRSNRQG